MNRSIARVGIGVILVGFALLAFPIVVTGHELFDLEQEAGLLVAPVGLVVVLIAAVSHDPERTTVGGTFGNPDEAPRRAAAGAEPERRSTYHPKEPVNCRYCWALVQFDQATCPRCGRPRDCRCCGRPLGWVLERATCPRCARAEAFCNCPRLDRPAAAGVGPRGRRG